MYKACKYKIYNTKKINLIITNPLVILGALLSFVSLIAFLVEILRLIFISRDKQTSAKIIFFAIVAFAIGFGFFVSNVKIGDH